MRSLVVLVLLSLMVAACQRGPSEAKPVSNETSGSPAAGEASAGGLVLGRSDTAAIVDAALRKLLSSSVVDSTEVYLAWGWGGDSTLDAPPADLMAGLADLGPRVRSVSELGAVTRDDLTIRRNGPVSRLADPQTGALPRIVYPRRIEVVGENEALVQLTVWRSDTIRGWRLGFKDGHWRVEQELWPIIVCDL